MAKTIQKLVYKFLKGNLSLTEEKQLVDWAKSNRQEFLNIQNEIAPLLQYEENTETTERWNLLKSLIQGQAKNGKPGRIIRLNRNVLKIAAAFLIGILATSAFYFLVPSFEQQNMYVRQQEVKTPYGAKTQFVLPDSSVVWLNSGSQLFYPSEFRKSRLVSLEGEAFFEVRKAKEPFIVKTVYGDVKVKGTSFNVKAFAGEPFETTLVKGKVSVRNKTGDEATLNPGEQSSSVSGRLEVKPVNTAIVTSWVDGKLIFRKELLPDVIHRLERWYNVKINLDNDQRLSKIWFTGTIEMESFSEILQLLQTTSPIKYTYDEKTRVITIKHK